MMFTIGIWAAISARSAIGPNGEKLIARLDEIHAETGKKVSLVGWSLGGTLGAAIVATSPRSGPASDFAGFADHRQPEIDQRMARLSVYDRAKD